MKRAEKAQRIQAILDELYPETPVPLDHTDAYTLLIAVLLSAQCTDERVNQVTPALFARAATPAAMVRLTPEEIREIIKPCGLSPQKSRAIHRLSEMLLEDHGGQVPGSIEELERLPGVGHKTASVVVAQAFGVPAFPVDTHIHRLAARWGLSAARNVEQTERDLKQLFPRETWNAVHLQIIFFGREHCPARGHVLEDCPICSWAASKARAQAERRAGTGKGVETRSARPRSRR
ncbi:endonuclease III [Engelhardtia mirabilis]|uniref:Endonuclease III n=1 Tax=Engelhardtia mirabilis TaxID=2528011 RepID=A0A518BQ86_9BACT|nr:Ultraviolet N-glycosylase/AP lyase [Planctomycetes bacterium Pla133]QDV03456.1 Ultraviolet N-glycosylase/AP lyase [Planctomycetes bacterium Pla86]